MKAEAARQAEAEFDTETFEKSVRICGDPRLGITAEEKKECRNECVKKYCPESKWNKRKCYHKNALQLHPDKTDIRHHTKEYQSMSAEDKKKEDEEFRLNWLALGNCQALHDDSPTEHG